MVDKLIPTYNQRKIFISVGKSYFHGIRKFTPRQLNAGMHYTRQLYGRINSRYYKH